MKDTQILNRVHLKQTHSHVCTKIVLSSSFLFIYFMFYYYVFESFAFFFFFFFLEKKGVIILMVFSSSEDSSSLISFHIWESSCLMFPNPICSCSARLELCTQHVWPVRVSVLCKTWVCQILSSASTCVACHLPSPPSPFYGFVSMYFYWNLSQERQLRWHTGIFQAVLLTCCVQKNKWRDVVRH